MAYGVKEARILDDCYSLLIVRIDSFMETVVIKQVNCKYNGIEFHARWQR